MKLNIYICLRIKKNYLIDMNSQQQTQFILTSKLNEK